NTAGDEIYEDEDDEEEGFEAQLRVANETRMSGEKEREAGENWESCRSRRRKFLLEAKKCLDTVGEKGGSVPEMLAEALKEIRRMQEDDEGDGDEDEE